MKYIKSLLCFTFILVTLISCTNDSSKDLTEDIGLNDATYVLNVKSIIDNNCIFCHAATPINGAPMPLTTYEEVKDAIQNRPLIDRISRDQGAPGMMPNGGTRLPQASINVIIKWQEDGLQE